MASMVNNIVNFPFQLCNSQSFCQYLIKLGDGKQRLFTVIGESHLATISKFCNNATTYPPYNYIDYIFQISQGKKISVFLELPIYGDKKDFKDRLSSFNINQILSLEDHLKKNLEEGYKLQNNPLLLEKMKFIPKVEKVDPRYLDEKEEFIANLYNNIDLKKITLENIRVELYEKENSFFQNRICSLMDTLFKNIKDSYDKDIYRKLGRYYAYIKSSFNEIKEHFKLNIKPKIEDYSFNIMTLKDPETNLLDSNMEKLLIDLRHFYAKIVDLYVYIKIYDKDSDDNSIIFIVGDSHSVNIRAFLKENLIFENTLVNGIINLNNSYY